MVNICLIIINYILTMDDMVSISISGLKSDFFCSDDRQFFIQPIIAFKDLNESLF